MRETPPFPLAAAPGILLNFRRTHRQQPVTSSIAPPVVDISKLRLGDARALLEHGTVGELPDSDVSPTEFVQSVIDGLCELSLKDPLTGLANRRHFLSVLEREIDGVARSGEPALLLMLDIDHFKSINDTHGHLAGDRVLQAVAKCLSRCIRPMDTVARYGGEEFAVVLPNCLVSVGEAVAERIRKTVETLMIPVSATANVKVTISIGGAYAPSWVRSTAPLWIERADNLLYRAKSDGRNRVVIDQQQAIAVSAEEKNLLFGHLALGEPAWLERVAVDPASGSASGVGE
ncbi:MAG: GGDEF domain-containing protein [Rhodoferax sp.]|nr:GGDEF domain-containing protein [Rhodoferax sp.]MBP9927736.1 GGDEF domain-containing protein [Rhodoferax sp.]